MKKIFVLFGILTLSFGLSACNLNSKNQDSTDKSQTSQINQSQTWNIQIKNEKKWVKKFVWFVATWCPHCQEEVPILQKFYNDFSWQVNMEINVLDNKPFPGVKTLPQNTKNAKSYKDYTNQDCGYVPSYVILDENGKVIEKQCGAKLTYEDLKNKLLNKNNLNSNKTKKMENKVVKKWDKVAVDYVGFFPDGKVFDTSIEEEAKKAGIYNAARTYAPLEFVVGAGQMIPCFDKAVEGMKIWEEKEITCQPQEAYGECDKTKVQKVEKAKLEEFKKAGYKLEKWEELPTQYGMLKIVDADDKTVTLDLNHPMCGKVLKFKIKLVDIK